MPSNHDDITARSHATPPPYVPDLLTQALMIVRSLSSAFVKIRQPRTNLHDFPAAADSPTTQRLPRIAHVNLN
jgi:hypothetical protein